MEIIVNTSPFTDGRIVQEVCIETNGQQERIMRFVINTKEKQVKEALVALGWTPPTRRRENGE